MIEKLPGMRADVVLCVTGGIAAYKACEVLRGLQDASCDIRVVMTQDATRFVSPVTFEALSGHPVAVDLYGYADSPIPHVHLAEWADLILVCPATANVLAKMAHGIADDCLTSCLVAADSPVVVAPAMNVHMWQNPATQANVAALRSRGVGIVGPVQGRLACGTTGEGKLSSVDEVVRYALVALGGVPGQELAGVRALVTAGPTHEPIDPVRFIANASSGKMGMALARALVRHGAEVTVVCGPCEAEPPEDVEVVRVTTAAEMLVATASAFQGCGLAICAAAVADYTPAATADHKLKKSKEPLEKVELVENPDILRALCLEKGRRVVVGFAAETDDLVASARTKLRSKGCDLIVANDVSRPDSTFGSDTDTVTLVDADGETKLGCLSKDLVAEAVVCRAIELRARGMAVAVDATMVMPRPGGAQC
ncbi:MAG: bifunctional phosphopantothenoylcysteine decarboxylase/phosphopantothenate--cysteine ligase CoaBC [Atopobiaceae bacterium]|jgi:phosphopantothenoylcysteine decarboxylase/phosphopantothenate--cysteine ligase|nr:bifunctional phosphopantothenoylcysteine decarboxylase/phosphopantothenate--cysteine ligase CoaBC [Atopobiaceae bacterium]MCH4180005.1 bifunctional phosphopantothenoylcysteine decarboxylase/phosphopantothenate--cysteine ligase CoaBC [Atopobiaceae bacterium]MCH4213943.1 bifunctional phosphopantothenoylcysteine decarboxylase/phosphopantothenate--cysteine ligase CoaBC [Atopobiaceae bacterium]MCH4230169.1 bifunctional phosphopantothenoylcysteine decarboxylase/phosphopantothenate--cysteine ligase 